MQKHIKEERRNGTEQWITFILSAGMILAATAEQIIRRQSGLTGNLSMGWVPYVAAVIVFTGNIRWNENTLWPQIQRTLRWVGLFMLIWAANGLPLDLLRLTPLIPLEVDWPGLVTKTLALGTAIIVARIALRLPDGPRSDHRVPWYAYAAFLLALPYPILRTCWALGGQIGLLQPDAAGHGFLPWLASIPWLLAAILSLFLISTPRRMPRKLLLTAGWFATAIVAMIGPAACWSMITKLITGEELGMETGIAVWVPCLFYGSWLLWAIAAGAATRSYQVRSVESAVR